MSPERLVSALGHSLFGFVACSTFQCISIGLIFFGDDGDVNLGREMDQEIRKNPKECPILQNQSDVMEYVKTVSGGGLGSPSIAKRGVYPYQFEVIYDGKTINAFATPGGYVCVYTGILKFVDNRATLAGVLGHEIAHAERRHCRDTKGKCSFAFHPYSCYHLAIEGLFTTRASLLSG